MKLMPYLRYARYITDHWSAGLALFTILHEIRGERKYGINTTGIEEIWQYDISGDDLALAESYQPSSYYVLEKLFRHFPKTAVGGTLMDFGCGKGRALVVAAASGFKNLIGIEIIYELAREAEQNLLHNKLQQKDFKFRIINDRAQHAEIPQNAGVFLFFNPFKEMLMKEVLGNILASYRQYPRDMYVFYLNPVYKHLFLECNFRELYHVQKLTYLEGSLLCLKSNA
jgi:SAM-dependent methyltransferase